jgi:prepilin-type N-terminal cleavage/methylation domain-containing protein
MGRPRISRRPGMTLLEVLIALAVFLLSLVALGRLVTWAGDRALDVQQRSRAAELCRSKLNEVQAGAVALSSQSDVPFDEDSVYHWSLDAEQGQVSGLWNVTVRVTCTRKGGSGAGATLSQMVLDPSMVGSTQDTPGASTTDDSSTTGGNSSSSTTPSTTPSASAPAAAAPAAAAPAAAAPAPKAAAPAAAPAAATPAKAGAAATGR